MTTSTELLLYHRRPPPATLWTPAALPVMMKPRMRRALPYLVVCLAVLLFFADVVVGSASFFFRDLLAFHLPFHHLVAQALRLGELPLWNPALHLGMPLAGDASAMPWYLPGWVLSALDDERAMAWFVVGHLLWASAGSAHLARVHGTRTEAAILAGLSYGLGGYLLGVHWNLIYLASSAWLPWVVATSTSLLREPTARRSGLAALCWSSLVYAGDAQLALMTAVVLLTQVLLLAAPKERLHSLRWLVVTAALAVGLAALQWIPTLVMVANAQRGQGLALDEVLRWSLSPQRLLDLLLPPDLGVRLADEDALDWAASLYPGLIAGALALVALLRPVDASRRFVLVTTLLFTVLALGEHTPLYRGLLALLPTLELFRYPHKLVVVACMAWSLAAALGLETVLDVAQRRPRFLAGVLASLAALGGWVLARQRTDVLAVHGTLAALALLAGLLLIERRLLRPAQAGWMLVACALVDLGLAQQAQRMVGDPAIYTETPAAVAQVRALGGGDATPRVHLTHALLVAAEGTRTDGSMGAVAWYARAAVDAARLLPNTAVARGLHYVQGYSPLEPVRPVDGQNNVQLRRLLDLCSVTAVITTSAPRLELGDVVRLEAPALNLSVVENTDRLPRAYVLDEGDASNLLSTPRSDVDLPVLRPVSGSRVHVVRDSMNQVVLQVATSIGGWLVLADRYDPDWQARVDDRAVAIHPALGLLRAIQIPAGEHRVVFRYRPRAVLWGAVVALLSAVLGVLVVARERRRRR
ncbi:MAG: YfhO family protein [Pseudomonadota bacterium]